MSDPVLQDTLPHENEETQVPLPIEIDEVSSKLYEKINPALKLFSDLPDFSTQSEVFVERLLEQINLSIRPDLLVLFTRDEEKEEWSLFFQHGIPEYLIKNGKLARAWQSLPTIISHEAEPLYSGDISKDRRFIGQVVRGINIRTLGGLTLRSGEKIYGSLSVGFYESDALSPVEQTAFPMMANLLLPALLQQHPKQKPIAQAEPEVQVETKAKLNPPQLGRKSLILTLDFSGRIQKHNAPFLRLSGLRAETLSQTLISQFLTKKSYSIYLSVAKKLKAGKTEVLPFELEFVKPGRRKRMLLAQLALGGEEGGSNALILSAEDITNITPLETELVYKNGLQAILNSLFDTMKNSVQQISNLATYPMDEDQALKEALEKGFSKIGVEGACFLRLQTGKKKLDCIADRGFSEDQLEQIEKHGIGAKEHLIWKIVDKNAPMLLTAKSEKAHSKKRLFGEEALASCMGVPIESEHQLWGVLLFFSREALFFDSDLRALTMLGKEVGAAIHQLKSFSILHNRIDSLKTLNEVSRSITKSLHLEHLLASIANNLKNMIGASNCYIFLEDGKRHLYYGAGASDQRDEATRKIEIKTNENHLIPLTARERHPYVVENASRDVRVGKKWMRTFKSRSLLSVPLIHKDRVIGVLVIDETRYFRKFTNDEVQKVSEMANQISTGVENAIIHHAVSRHRERLQTLSSAIVNVQEEERRRVAKKLREESAVALKAIQNDLDWLTNNITDPTSEMQKRLGRSKEEAGKTLEALKVLSGELRPAILDDAGLISTIKSVVNEFEAQTKAKVHLQIADTIKRMPARIEILLFRVVQESLANISSHAKADSIVISLEKRDPYIHLYVTDDGQGFDVKRYFTSPQLTRKEIGILGMKERVELAGGTFYIDSQSGQGTRISVRIPLVRRNNQNSN